MGTVVVLDLVINVAINIYLSLDMSLYRETVAHTRAFIEVN